MVGNGKAFFGGPPALRPDAAHAARWAFTLRGMDAPAWLDGSADVPFSPRARATTRSKPRLGPPYRDAGRARITSFHEAGHGAAVWQVWGADCLDSVEVHSSGDLDGHLGGCTYHELSGATPHERGLVIAAGPAGARLLGTGYARWVGYHALVGQNDKESFLDAGLDEGLWPAYLDLAYHMLGQRAEALHAVADRLFATGYVDGADFDRLIRGLL
jgi:hypothetical protein